MRILVTGAAGFIGMHVVVRLLSDGYEVMGIDNLNDYYDKELKVSRLNYIGSPEQFRFSKTDIANQEQVSRSFTEFEPEIVINLAAQAGVRYSIENPDSYIKSNLVGFTNILEACRQFNVEHLIYASSSSVYGLNEEMPFHEGQNADHPLALYGATKKANESLAHSYSHLFNLPTTGLRLFTVYGPWGRPDMALFKFTDAILTGRPIDIYNHGQMTRDFTFIDDIVEGIARLAMKPAQSDKQFDAKIPDAGRSSAPWMIFNIGNGQPTPLMKYITALEQVLGKKAQKNFLEMQPGDVMATASDASRLNDWVGFAPDTPISEGVTKFVEWYRLFYCR